MCSDQVKAYVDAGCTFVELHHYDLSVAEAFKTYGYEVMTFMRDPQQRAQSEMNKYLHAKNKEPEAWREFQIPDQSMRLYTSCERNQWFGRSKYGPDRLPHDMSTSCSVEFRDNTTEPRLKTIGTKIFENLNVNKSYESRPDFATHLEVNAPVAGVCDKNATVANYKVLYDVAKKWVDTVDFVGVIERTQVMFNTFAKHFGITADLPELLRKAPTMCSGSSCKTDRNLTVDVPRMRRTLLYDQKLWCQMSESLTRMAKEEGVDLTAAADEAAVKSIAKACEKDLDPLEADAAGTYYHNIPPGAPGWKPMQEWCSECPGAEVPSPAVDAPQRESKDRKKGNEGKKPDASSTRSKGGPDDHHHTSR